MKQVNIIVGRFQPITIGHMKCVEEAYKKTGRPTLFCMIETSVEKTGPRHPFPSSLLLPLYKDLFKANEMVEGFVLVKNANIVDIDALLQEKGYQISSWTCGTDRVKSYERMSHNYKDQIHLSPDFQVIEVKRGEEDVSATKLREALREDDYKTFTLLFPCAGVSSSKVKKIYKKLREGLLRIPEHISLGNYLNGIIII